MLTVQTQCEGACMERHGAHSGDVRRVRVLDPRTGADWQCYDFCELAVEDDRRLGYEVTEVVEAIAE